MNCPAFTFRQCLLLCIPALILGFIVRVSLVKTTPEGYYGPDSNSYFSTTAKLWIKGRLACDDKRRWSYPLLLALSPVLPGTPVRSIPIVQHAIGLMSVVGLGWIIGHLVVLRRLWVPLVTMLYALWPRSIWYEHEIVAESLFLCSFILTAALAFPTTRLKDPKGLFWFLLSAAFLVSLKPHGRGLWLGAILVAALITRNPLKWNWKCWGAVLAGVLVIVTSGSSSQGHWLLLSSTLPLVHTEGAKWEQYRKELKPLVDPIKADLYTYPWKQKNYKKRLSSQRPEDLSPVWAKLAGRDAEFSKVCKDLSHEAILKHPVDFMRLTMTKVALAFAGSEANGRLDPERFWKDQNLRNDKRWKSDRNELEFLYGMKEDAYCELSKERSQRTYPWLKASEKFSDFFTAVIDRNEKHPGNHSFTPSLFGWLTLLGLCFCLTPSRFAATSILWLPTMLYLGTVFAVGDRLSRYVQPVEWILFLLAAIALDGLIRLIFGRFLPAAAAKKGNACDTPAASPA